MTQAEFADAADAGGVVPVELAASLSFSWWLNGWAGTGRPPLPPPPRRTAPTRAAAHVTADRAPTGRPGRPGRWAAGTAGGRAAAADRRATAAARAAGSQAAGTPEAGTPGADSRAAGWPGARRDSAARCPRTSPSSHRVGGGGAAGDVAAGAVAGRYRRSGEQRVQPGSRLADEAAAASGEPISVNPGPLRSTGADARPPAPSPDQGCPPVPRR